MLVTRDDRAQRVDIRQQLARGVETEDFGECLIGVEQLPVAMDIDADAQSIDEVAVALVTVAQLSAQPLDFGDEVALL